MTAGRENVIHVTGLSGLMQMAAQLGQVDLLTLTSPGTSRIDWQAVIRRRHVVLTFNDITEPRDGLVAPDETVVSAVLAFGRGAAPDVPLLVHCWAGISRSSAAAYIIACDRNPGREVELACELRRRAPFATPNRLLVSLADTMLRRGGAMTAAIAAIGRGADAYEGTPYALPLASPDLLLGSN